MLHHKIRIHIVFHQHLRHIHTIRNAVVEHNSHTSFLQLLIHLNVLAVTAETNNQPIHHKLFHHLQIFQFPAGILVTLGYHHLLVLLVENLLYSAYHLRSIRCMHLRHNDSNGIGTSHLQVHRYRITLVTKSLRLLHHHVSRLFAYVLVIGQCSGNSRD